MCRRASTSFTKDADNVEEKEENAENEPFFYPSSSWLDMQSIGGADWKASVKVKEEEPGGENSKDMVEPKVIQTLATHIDLHSQLEKVLAQGFSEPDAAGDGIESHRSQSDDVSSAEAEEIWKVMRRERLEHLFRLICGEYAHPTIGDLQEWVQSFFPVHSELQETDIFVLTKGRSKSEPLRKEAFISIMLKVLDPTGDWEMFEVAWLTIMYEMTSGTSHQDMLSEINPPEYSEVVATFPTHRIAPYIGCSELRELMEEKSHNLVVIDVRTEEEREISSIKGSRYSDIVLDKSAEKGYRFTKGIHEILYGGDPTLEEEQLYDYYQNATIVTVCNTGLRSAAAAMEFTEDLDRLVHCLCGGLINYFNSGGEMVDPAGEAVEKLHPGSDEFKKFVVRENKILDSDG
ncbi:hypothetical protein BSKO_04107 [Bryopsis sp. KO-2023]|nr:hypothetical protein BSKO_04107 [Bryopsis sp. KO-2023]